MSTRVYDAVQRGDAGFGWAGWTKLRQRWFKPRAGSPKIITDLRKTRVRLNVYSPAAAGLAAGAWRWSQIISGKYDLIIDEPGRALELPLTHGRKARRRVPFSGVQSVQVDKTRKGAGAWERWSYAPTLEIAGPNPESERLAEWLREKLPPKPSP